MPTTVPVIQDSAELDTRTGRQRIGGDANAFGAQQARATQALSAGLGALGEGLEEVDDNFNEADARDLDNQLSARIRERLYNPEDGYFSSERGRGRNAAANRAAIEAEIDQAAVELTAGARNPRSAALFQNVARQRVTSALGDIAGHASRQDIAYRNEVDATALSEALDNIVAAYDDPVNLAANLATADGVIARTSQRNGLGPELQTRAMQEFRSDAFSRAIVQLAATDPEAAEEMFALRAPEMTAQDRAELGSQMRGARRVAEDETIDEAWTYVAAGREIPSELWARVPGRGQIDIQNERRRRAEGGAGGGNRALVEDLRVMAVADPRRFARQDLRSIRGQLGSQYDELAISQANIRNGDEDTDVSRTRTSFNAVRDIAATTFNMRLSAEDPENLSDAARAFNAALLREVEGFNAANPSVGIDSETAQQMIGRAWVSMRGRDVTRAEGRVRGDRGRGRSAVPAATEVVVPYDAIPPDVALRIGTNLQRRLNRVPTRGEVENAYASFLQNRRLQIGGE